MLASEVVAILQNQIRNNGDREVLIRVRRTKHKLEDIPICGIGWAGTTAATMRPFISTNLLGKVEADAAKRKAARKTINAPPENNSGSRIDAAPAEA